MRYITISIFLLLNFSALAIESSSKRIESKDFDFVLFDHMKRKDVEDIIQSLEKNRQRILDDLKPESMPKAEIYIWDKQSSWKRDNQVLLANHPSSGGYIDPLNNRVKFIKHEPPNTIILSIFGLFKSSKQKTLDEFYAELANPSSVAVHEYTHLVVYHVDPSLDLPPWLWESLACYEAQTDFDLSKLAKDISDLKQPFSKLGKDQNIYFLGYDIVEYIVQTWNISVLNPLIKSSGNVQSVLGLEQSEFEDGFWEYLQLKHFSPRAK